MGRRKRERMGYSHALGRTVTRRRMGAQRLMFASQALAQGVGQLNLKQPEPEVMNATFSANF